MKNYIEITDLSKKYQIFHETQPMYSTLREALTCNAKNVLNRLCKPFSHPKQKKKFEDFWALKDVNFTVREGDRLGIIGRNGAGKSTLLKILSKITAPTTGQLKMRGRVSSLLEVGTGFHPELTGKENIFLNGAILGMKRQEITTKFDAIVEFAEVQQFLDTPVKRYSSGMIARLGFAIAAHLDPDILIVDEVLAVGDAAFQEKCLRKLNDLGTAGRTVLFVSHDINAVMKLCNKGVYLEKGKVAAEGDIETCVHAYMKQMKSISTAWKGNLGDEHIRFLSLKVKCETHSNEFFLQNETVCVEIDYEVLKPSKDNKVAIEVWNQRNQLLACSNLTDGLQCTGDCVIIGQQKLKFLIDAQLFHEGEYFIKLDCVGKQNRKVVGDEIMLKFSVYGQKSVGPLESLANRSGISLGNRWKKH